jgi:hypothetical protein
MDPHVNHGQGKKRIEACGESFPAHDQAPVLPLKPGKRPLGLVARDNRFDRPPARFAALPHPFGNLGTDPAAAEAMPEVFGVIPLIHRQHLEAFPWSASFAGAGMERIQQRDDLGPFVAIGRRRARGQWHASPVRETMDEDTLAFSAIGDSLTAPFARGKRSHRPRRIATESSRVPRPARAGALASPRGCRRPASAAATDARRSWRPIGGREGDHTSGSR